MTRLIESINPGNSAATIQQGRAKRKLRDSGQSMLEFALMLPFLMLLMVGVIEIGRAIYYTVEVNHAATAGVVYGSQNATTAQNVGQMQTYATADAAVTGMSATAVNGCACDYGNGTSCSYPLASQSNCPGFSCTSGGQVVECVQVTTQATITPIFHFPGLPMSYQANGEAVMRVRK